MNKIVGGLFFSADGIEPSSEFYSMLFQEPLPLAWPLLSPWAAPLASPLAFPSASLHVPVRRSYTRVQYPQDA